MIATMNETYNNIARVNRNTYISFDISTKKSGVAVFEPPFANIKTFVMENTKEQVNEDYLQRHFYDTIKNSIENIYVTFENLGVGRNGLMFAELIGAIKVILRLFAETFKKVIVFHVIQPSLWQSKILKLNSKAGRKEMKETSLRFANRYALSGRKAINDNDMADAINILIYMVEVLKLDMLPPLK